MQRARASAEGPAGHKQNGRALAKDVGADDEFGGIPEARWMRAMTFERLVRDKRFASELATTAVGRLDLARPTKVVIVKTRRKIGRFSASKGPERLVSFASSADRQ